VPKARTLFFIAPKQVEIREVTLPALKENEVLVEVNCSAISAGTEMLVYRGQFPRLTDVHDNLSSDLKYPLAYGYACVGKVVNAGKSVQGEWQNKAVFGFQPHTSHFITTTESLLPIPLLLKPETASFLPSMETAVNLVQDGAPLLGERVLVLGQGIIGLLSASLLLEFPLAALITADHFELRRAALDVEGAVAGAHTSLDSSRANFRKQAAAVFKSGSDLTLELSGSPAALNDAIALTAFSGRVVIGSWYGEKRAEIDLGGGFHRSRIKLISSQVSTISAELSTRWNKARRFEIAWEALKRIKPEKWITHRFPLDQAGHAYQLLDENPQEAIQVLLEYPS